MSYSSGFGDAIADALNPYVTVFANNAYNTLRADFERDADVWVGAMKPYLQDAVKEMFTDAGLQQSLKDTKTQIIMLAAATGVATALLTVGLIKVMK